MGEKTIFFSPIQGLSVMFSMFMMLPTFTMPKTMVLVFLMFSPLVTTTIVTPRRSLIVVSVVPVRVIVIVPIRIIVRIIIRIGFIGRSITVTVWVIVIALGVSGSSKKEERQRQNH